MSIDYKDNPKILNDFLFYLQNVKGYSKGTIKVYNTALIQFCKFIKEYLNIEINISEFNIFTFLQIKEAEILAFLVYLNFSKDNNPNTRELKLCAIRKFYKWLLSTNPKITKENPAFAIGNIQKIERLPKYLNLENAIKLQEIFTQNNSKYYIRNNMIILLFLNTGMRVSELVNINLKDINWNEKSITVIGKNNREREVYFNQKCKEKLLEYISIKNKNQKEICLEKPLFESRLNKRISVRTVEEICKKAYKLMGLEKQKLTTHSLRHTAATLMYMYSTQDIMVLKRFLGHESLASTQIYTHVYNKTLKEAVNKNPLCNYKVS